MSYDLYKILENHTSIFGQYEILPQKEIPFKINVLEPVFLQN